MNFMLSEKSSFFVARGILRVTGYLRLTLRCGAFCGWAFLIFMPFRFDESLKSQASMGRWFDSA
jgi:hypothetical protein